MPLEGVHKIRQADTLFAGFSYCMEQTPFFKPRIVQRGVNPGTSIGEFPVFSYLISIPCKLTGVWTESAPKLINFFFLILGIFVWFKVLTYLNGSAINFLSFSVFYFFSTNTLVHYQIPIPDHFALFLMGCAIWLNCILKNKTNSKEKIGFMLRGIIQVLIPIFFLTAFLMRPYLIPLIALFIFPLQFEIRPFFQFSFLSSLFLSILGFLLWYKWWAPNQSTIFYYNTQILSLTEVALQWRGVFQGLYEQLLRSYLNFIGIILLGIYAWKGKKLFKPNSMIFDLIILAFLSYLFVVLIKGDHGTRHGYYFSAFFIYLTFLLTLLSEMILSPRIKYFILYGFIIIGTAQSQHYFHGKFQSYFIELTELRSQIPTSSLVATYAATESNDPVELYSLQRAGLAFATTDLPEATKTALENSYNHEISDRFCPRRMNYLLIARKLDPRGTQNLQKNYSLIRCVENEILGH
ncbi:MAG: hypothetical protein ACK5P5_09650 [Pseudobdellovibrionaceae bacterium]